MSTVSASSYDLSSNPMKRKRGRPRKEEVSGSESNRGVLQSPNSNTDLVGQEVSGFFVGVFDAGYLLTVQVGSSGPFMNGLVFDPQQAVPISTENDVAPHLPMLRRTDLSPPVEEDFINRNDMMPKNPMEGPARAASTETMKPAKTLRIFLGGAAAETSHPQPQNKSEGTPISAGLMDVSRPSNGFNPSVVTVASPLEASIDASAGIPQKTPLAEGSKANPHDFSVALNIPKEALAPITEGLPLKSAPSVDLKPPEGSVISQKDTLDETSKADFEVGPILEHDTGETRSAGLLSQGSEEPSKNREANDPLPGSNSISGIPMGDQPNVTVAEKLEDGKAVSEAFQP